MSESETSPTLDDLLSSKTDVNKAVKTTTATMTTEATSFNRDHVVEALISPRFPSTHMTDGVLSRTLSLPTSSETLNTSSDYHSSESVHLYHEINNS